MPWLGTDDWCTQAQEALKDGAVEVSGEIPVKFDGIKCEGDLDEHWGSPKRLANVWRVPI